MTQRIRFAIIGWGWRAEFFHRIATLVPDRFEITGVLLRSEDKAAALRAETGLPVVTNLDDLIADTPEFVVLSIARGATGPYLKQLFDRQIPVLSETPPGETPEELADLWEHAQRTNAKVQVAEQYPFQPLYAAWLKAIGQGLIGEVQNITISALHGYHGTAMIRRVLGIDASENCRVSAVKDTFKLTETMGRGGPVFDGEIVDSSRVHARFEFESGKIAYFDFSDPAQYHSFIRTRQLNIQGTRGEIDDLGVRYLADGNVPVTLDLNRIDQGVYNNQEWAHIAIFLGERELYRNPFTYARLNDDEIAIAACLDAMSHYVKTGEDFYSLRDALQDTYLAQLMELSISSGSESGTQAVLDTQPMPWQ